MFNNKPVTAVSNLIYTIGLANFIFHGCAEMRLSPVLLKRSAWKVPYIVSLPIKQAREKNIPIRTNARSCTILPSFVGLMFEIHNGRTYKQVRITENMIGMKLGEFAPTRIRHVFGAKK